MKIIAFYLPQFHTIPENDKWWGKGFTEWTNVKKAKPLFEGHRQPRIPLNNNYYNLLDDNRTLKWQCETAKKYGIYGFCFYHYWFNGKMLLEKPVENFLSDKSIEMPFCLCWANEHWTNAWVSNQNKILIEQTYGDIKEWEEHYLYLRQFFKDSRYIKNNDKPLLVIYRPEIIPCIKEMMDYLKKRAVEDGFNGMEFAYQSFSYDLTDYRKGLFFDYDIEYQPTYAITFMKTKTPYFLRRAYRLFRKVSEKCGITVSEPDRLRRYSYEQIWRYVIEKPPISKISVACGFADWDNTPRRGKSGWVTDGYSNELFEKNMARLIEKTREVYKKDFMFFFAWNEWAEGGYLEPDSENGYAKLNAIKNALIETGEFEEICE